MKAGKPMRQLAGETAVYGLSGVVAQTVNVFLFPLFAKTLSLSQYGLITTITAFSGLVGTFVILGLDSATARFFYDSQDATRRRQVIGTWFWCQVVFGLTAALVIALCSRGLAGLLLGSVEWTWVILIVNAVIFTRSMAKILGNWLRYQRRAWATIGVTLMNTLLLIGLSIAFVIPGRMGLKGVYWAQAAAGMITAVFAIILLRDWMSPETFSLPLLKSMLIYGLPLIPAALASWVTASADRFFLKHFCGLDETGLYGAAVTIASAVTLATGAFQMAWGPFAFSILEKDDSKQVYSRVLTMYAFWGCWLACCLSLFSPQLLKWLARPLYHSAASSVPWLAFGYLAIGVSFIAALGSTIVKKSLPVAMSIFMGAAVNTALNFILIPRFGKDGAAAATFLAYTAAAVFLFARSQKLYPIPYRFGQAFACLALAGLIIAVNQLLLSNHAGMGPIGVKALSSLLFIPLGFGLKVITKEKIRLAAGKIVRMTIRS
jgi:O-antigen/teichoic acid export membrane protein